jgi:hypothetical protein
MTDDKELIEKVAMLLVSIGQHEKNRAARLSVEAHSCERTGACLRQP